MGKGLDYSFSRPSELSMRTAGYEFVCRYLSSGSKKNIDLLEVKRIKDAGLQLVLVWETLANRALDGFSAGEYDATEAQNMAIKVGCEDIPAIYFAVDFDASPNDQVAINEYFRGVANILGLNRTGAYGGFWVIKRLFDANMIKYGWQTYAWSGGQWDPRAQLQQIKNGLKFENSDVDLNQSTQINFGQWPQLAMSNPIDEVVNNKVNEYKYGDNDTIYQIFAIPGWPFFQDVLKDSLENVRTLPGDWPHDPKDWVAQREFLRPELDRLNASFIGLSQNVDNVTKSNNLLVAENKAIVGQVKNLTSQADQLAILAQQRLDELNEATAKINYLQTGLPKKTFLQKLIDLFTTTS